MKRIFIFLLLFAFLAVAILFAKNDAIGESPLLGSLEWNNVAEEKVASNGIISDRKGWYISDEELCTGVSKDELCEKGIQSLVSYTLYFEFLPNNNIDEYPFGVPISFRLVITKVKSDQIEKGYFWQGKLANSKNKAELSLFNEELFLSKQELDDALLGKKPELAALQVKFEVMAGKILLQYFLCLKSRANECKG